MNLIKDEITVPYYNSNFGKGVQVIGVDAVKWERALVENQSLYISIKFHGNHKYNGIYELTPNILNTVKIVIGVNKGRQVFYLRTQELFGRGSVVAQLIDKKAIRK